MLQLSRNQKYTCGVIASHLPLGNEVDLRQPLEDADAHAWRGRPS